MTTVVSVSGSQFTWTLEVKLMVNRENLDTTTLTTHQITTVQITSGYVPHHHSVFDCNLTSDQTRLVDSCRDHQPAITETDKTTPSSPVCYLTHPDHHLCRYCWSLHSCQVSLLSAHQTEEHPPEPDQDHPAGWVAPAAWVHTHTHTQGLRPRLFPVLLSRFLSLPVIVLPPQLWVCLSVGSLCHDSLFFFCFSVVYFMFIFLLLIHVIHSCLQCAFTNKSPITCFSCSWILILCWLCV